MNCLAYRPEDAATFAGTADGNLYMFEETTCIAATKAHDGAVTALVWAADHGLVSSGRDEFIKLWDFDVDPPECTWQYDMDPHVPQVPPPC